MEGRDELGPESDYESTRVDVAHFNGVAIILNDGEILTKSEGLNVRSGNRIDRDQLYTHNARNACCFLCGESGHIAYRCRLRNKGFACFRCGETGHKMYNCNAVSQGHFAPNPRPLVFGQCNRRPVFVPGSRPPVFGQRQQCRPVFGNGSQTVFNQGPTRRPLFSHNVQRPLGF